MDFIQQNMYHWYLLSISHREKLLKELKDIIKTESVWDEVPIEALANTPDFNSLPGDLCGHLMLALTDSEFSCEKFSQRLRRFKLVQERGPLNGI